MIFNICIGWFSLAHEHMKIGFYIIMIAMMAVKNVQRSLHYETIVQPILAIAATNSKAVRYLHAAPLLLRLRILLIVAYTYAGALSTQGRRRNMKTQVSLSKCIKCFPCTLRLRTLKTQQTPVSLDLCLNKTRARKSRDKCHIIVLEKPRFQN